MLNSMSFLHPYLLLAMAAIAIPIAIHLFNFRKFKKVYFTNVRYLTELKQQTRRQSRLRQLIILALRILAVISLVFAFAQPYIPVSDTPVRKSAVNVVSVYIDNSYSMGALGDKGALLDMARAKAEEIASAYGSGDIFQLITNDFEGRHQRLVSREEFNELLADVKLTPVVRTTSQVMARQAEILKSHSSPAKSAYLISDFQASSTEFPPEPDTTVMNWLLPLKAQERENLAIDSSWFDVPVHLPGQSTTLMVRIRNTGQGNMENIPVRLSVNGSQKALASVDLEGGQVRDVALSFTSYEPGTQYGILEIQDYPVTFDDRSYFVFGIARSIPVLSITDNGENPYLRSLFGMDSVFSYSVSDFRNIDYGSLSSFRMIVLTHLNAIPSGLSQAMSAFVSGGGSLMIIPSEDTDIASYRSFLSSLGMNYFTEVVESGTRVSGIDLQHPLLRDVFEKMKSEAMDNLDLPSVKRYYRLSRLSEAKQLTVMSLVNNDAFLVSSGVGQGTAYLLSVPLDDRFSNFQRHAVFVPTLYRVALLSAGGDAIYHIIGSSAAIELQGMDTEDEAPLRMVNRNGGQEFIPGQRSLGSRTSLDVRSASIAAGHYDVIRHSQVVKSLAFNYDRRESELKQYEPDELRDMLGRQGIRNVILLRDTDKPLTESISEMNQGIRLWKLFIIFALVFLAAEVALLRFWK